jgi:hypothetical protein
MKNQHAQTLLVELLRENADPHSTMEGVLHKTYVDAILRALEALRKPKRSRIAEARN